MDPTGTAAIVTGAASGLGAATAAALAAAGARVVAIDLPGSDAATRVGALGDRVEFVPGDVRDEDAIGRAVQVAVDGGAPLRVAVNCAGVATPGRVVGRRGPLDLDAFRRVVDINLVGTFNVLRLAAAAMADEPEAATGGRGVIVNTASIAAWDGQVGQAAYAASKGAVAALSLPVARDLARHGIRCVALAPGVFHTPMVDGLDDEVIDDLASGVPFPSRLGRPTEFADLVLAVVHNDYLNGTVVRLDGALRMV